MADVPWGRLMRQGDLKKGYGAQGVHQGRVVRVVSYHVETCSCPGGPTRLVNGQESHSRSCPLCGLTLLPPVTKAARRKKQKEGALPLGNT